MSINELEYRYMTNSERSKVIEEIKDNWISDHNNKNIQGFPFISSILKTDFDVTLGSVKYNGLALSMASEDLTGNSVIVTAAVNFC